MHKPLAKGLVMLKVSAGFSVMGSGERERVRPLAGLKFEGSQSSRSSGSRRGSVGPTGLKS